VRLPLRRILVGFAAGAAAGWAAGLLRRPATAPEGSSADEAIHLPREDFGGAEEAAPEIAAPEPAAPVAEPHEHPPPRKATAPSVRRSPGARKAPASGAGGSEPATPAPRTPPTTPAKAAKPAARKPAARKPAKKAAPDPAEAAAAALREGHAEATELLAGAEAEATPPPAEPADPARRRRRRQPEA